MLLFSVIWALPLLPVLFYYYLYFLSWASSLKIEITKSYEKDHYENGCDGNWNDLGVIETLRALNDSEILKIVENYGQDPMIFDDRIQLQFYEDANGQKVRTDDHIYELFKKGEVILYATTLDFYISWIEQKDFTNEDLKSLFPKLEIY